MKSNQPWTVRPERQPHRDAVWRLRQAYGLLWQMSSRASARADTDRRAEKASANLQEVQ
jgi:transposase